MYAIQDEYNQEIIKIKKIINDFKANKKIETEKEIKFERQIETLKQVISLQETMNDKLNKSQTGCFDKQSLADTLDNIHLISQSEDNTHTNAAKENIKEEVSK